MHLTVISHFWNEEFLLPYWLSVHRRVFDHGILIDYASTDRSRAIIREMVPHWEVYPSRNETFDSETLDAEVMEYERGVHGWKIALNTTEILFHPEPREYLSWWERTHPDTAIGMQGIVMVDHPDDREKPVDGRPLHLQRHHGYFDHNWAFRKPRYFHKFPDGAYIPGRHHTLHPYENRTDFFFTWWALSPYRQVLPRRMQIKDRISQADRHRGRGLHHLMSERDLEHHYSDQWSQSTDLSPDPRWRGLVTAWKERYGDE